MESCDCCGKRVDERSMRTVVAPDGRCYFVCQACQGTYDDQELLEKCEQVQSEIQSGQTRHAQEPKPGD